MTITAIDIKHIAYLSRLKISEQDIDDYAKELANILQLIEQMNQLDTTQVPPLANPLEATQRLREDLVTEVNVRDTMQLLAPQVVDGLYLVPLVIDEE